MARCLICGRRWAGASPPCGHVVDVATSAPSGSHDADDLPAVELPGYRIGELIGRGGFGTVLEATRVADQRLVAIKVVHRSHLQAYERLALEARALESIGPPHVPQLHESGALADGSPYLVIERIQLPTLADQLAVWAGPLERRAFVAVADAILAALQATHACGIVHRDLKPENIFIQEAPVMARLIDFGIAKTTEPSIHETGTGLALGTPEYMAPEQCEGRSALDLRTDIYAAGVVLYEMLTGRPPFFGSSAEVREAQLGRRPVPPSRVAEVPPIFDEVLLRCLAKEPVRRFEDVESLRLALAEANERDNPSLSGALPGFKAQAAATSSQRQHMGLLFFAASTSTGVVKQALVSLGGQLIAVEGSRCVALFGLESGGNPVQRAFDSAQALIGQGICSRVLVDHERVRVRRRPDGSQRVFSASFMRPDRFPLDSDPAGALITTAATEALAELRVVEVRDGVLRELQAEAEADTDATVFQLGTGSLIGREESFHALLASATAAVSDRIPTTASVLSEPGLGKSHLCASVLSEIRMSLPAMQVIQLRAREPLGGENYETLRALLRAVLHLPSTAPGDGGRRLLESRLGPEIGAEVWPAAALALGWISADAAEVRKLSAAPAALRAAATRAAGEALRRLASTTPVCCVLDDAHFADETTLDALEYATLADTRAPLWVCVLTVPSFEQARPTWARRAARVCSIRLEPLASEHAAALCRRLLKPAENVSLETIQRIVEQTYGSPLLLVELVRGIKRHGLIRRHARGDAWYLATDELEALPDLPKVEWLAERELATLPPELAAHARLVALLGTDVAAAEVEGVLGELEADGLGDTFPLDAQVGVRRLLAHGLLVTHRDGRVGFRHQIIREHVAQSIPEDIRMRVHEAAFRFYRDAWSIPDRHRLPRLARHAAQSGQAKIASTIYFDLAEQAASRHGYVDAELMYSRALDMMPVGDEASRMRAYNGRGLMRYRLSRFEDGLHDLDRARDIARQMHDMRAQVELYLDEATVLDWMQDFRKSRALVEEAKKWAVEAETGPLIEARLGMGMGRAAYRFRDWDSARRQLEAAAKQAETLGDPGYETMVISLLLLGLVLVAQNHVQLATTAFDRVIGVCEEHGDKLHLAGALSNRRDLWISRKDVERAAADGLRCRQIGREIGQAELEYICAYNLAELYYFAGDLDAAWPHLERAVDIEPSNSKKPLSRLLQSRILTYCGRTDEAKAVLEVIAAAQEQSRCAGDVDALFIESEEILYEMLMLAVLQAPWERWQALRARAEQGSQPEEIAEMVELAGLTELRRGRSELGLELLCQALSACSRTSHLIEERIKRQLQTAASQHVLRP